MSEIRLTDIYSEKSAEKLLYHLLGERDMTHAISHTNLPPWDKHVEFVRSRPYEAWYLIRDEDRCLGSIYITKDREVGIFLFKRAQGRGYGTLALDELNRLHPGPLLANISPNNNGSQRFFERHGFRHIQNTLKRDVA